MCRSEVKSLSRVRLFATPWTVAYQAPPSTGFSRQEWVAISFSRGSSRPRDRTWISHIVGRRFTVWASREVHYVQRKYLNLACCCLVIKSCLTLLQPHELSCNPMNCSLPGSSVHGISYAGMAKWVAISFSRGFSWPRGGTHVTCIGSWILHLWAISEAQNVAETAIHSSILA